MRRARVRLYCTDRGTHDPVDVYVYDGPIPAPPGHWRLHSTTSVEVDEHHDTAAVRRPGRLRAVVWSLPCRRDRGGCGRDPRPGNARMVALVNAIADTPTGEIDISYWCL